MTFIHEKNTLAFLCHFSFWSTWIKQGPNFPKHCKQQRKKIHETRIFKHWISGSSGHFSLRNTHTPTHTPVFPVVQTQHTHTHTPLFPMVQRRMHACAPPPPPAVLPMVQRQNLGGQGTRTGGVLQHQGKHTQGRRGQPQAPSGLRGVCVSTCQKKNLPIPRALRMVLPLQGRQKVKPSAILITLNKV